MIIHRLERKRKNLPKKRRMVALTLRNQQYCQQAIYGIAKFSERTSTSYGLDLSLRNPIHTAEHVFKSESFSVMSSDARPPAPFGWR